jgi:hypothetical protein
VAEPRGGSTAATTQICYPPALAARLPGVRGALLNSMALVEGHRHRQGWRYNIVRARRPCPRADG